MDIIIPITGRRASGKDTIAKMGIEKFSCAGSVALSDWFKKLLSEHFKIPLDDFYSSKKDEPLEKPLVIRRGDIARLLSKTSQLASKYVDVRYQRLSVGRWDGREISSIRELMLWWADEVISKNLGEVLHNVITAEAISKLPRKQDNAGFDVIFVTDARQFGQSSWFSPKNGFNNVYPIKIERPLGTLDQTAPEKAVDEFPEGYFFDVIVNDEDLPALEKKIQDILGKIRADMKRKTPKPPRVQQKQPKNTPKEKKENNA